MTFGTRNGTGRRAASGGPRADQPRRVQPRTQDPIRVKPAGPLVCEGCGAVYRAGRWSWKPPEGDEAFDLCEACRRLRTGVPGGVVRVAAGLEVDPDELRGLVRNIERRESAEHPLERLIGIERSGGETEIATTGVHLARCVAGALKRRFKDRVRTDYDDDAGLIRLDLRD